MVNQKKNLKILDVDIKKKLNNFNRQALHAKSHSVLFIPRTKKEVFFESKKT